MANEISVASMVSDGALAAYVVGDYQARNARPDDIRAAITFKPWAPNSGASSARTGLYDDDYIFGAASSEVSGGASNTDPDWGYFALTPARRLLKFQLTDLIAGTRGPNGADPSLFVGMMLRATGKTITDMVCAAAAAATEEVGDSAQPMSVDFIMDAKQQLDSTNTPGPYHVVMSARAFGELQESARGEVGILSWQEATAEVVSASGGFYKGMIAGVNVWVTDRVDTTDAGATMQNFMFGGGAFSYTEAPVAAFMADAMAANAAILDLGGLAVEFDRDADNGLTAMIGNYYPAVAMGQDLAVVRIETSNA